MRTAAICPTCATYENALCVLYNGEYLSNIDVEPLDSVQTALEKIDLALAGESGTSGTSGANGSSGSSGVSGSSGTSGGSSPLDFIQLEYEGAAPTLILMSIPKREVSFAGIELESGDVWADFNYTDVASGSSYNYIAGTTSLSFPNLNGFVSRNILTLGNSTLTSISFPVLKSAFYGLQIGGNNITNIDLSNLETIGSLSLSLGTIVNFTLDSFKYSTYLGIFGSALTTLNLPLLSKNLYQFSCSYNSSLTEINLSNTLTQMGDVYFNNNALIQSSVDDILIKLAALDGTGGTVLYQNKTVSLSGGTNATPSATGLAAKAILVARGCTVTNN